MLTTKDEVLSNLIRTEGYVSGESISELLGISRAAVNAAVKQLRSEGAEIISSTRKGYRLIYYPNRPAPGILSSVLGSKRADNIICLKTVTSTNDHLKTLSSRKAITGTVVISEEQTKGKGRLGRSFYSGSGMGLYYSYLIRPSGMIDNIPSITACTAVAVSKAIFKTCGITPSIKWVNDLVMNGKKICGILTEMTLEAESGKIDSIIIGIGINVNQKSNDEFPEDIRSRATSVYKETGKEVSLNSLAAALTEEMDRLSSNVSEGGFIKMYIDDYRKNCINTGKDISFVKVHDSEEPPLHGRAISVNDDLTLKVRFDDGRTMDISSGEVSIRGMYGYI